MNCLIADLTVKIPDTSEMTTRCKDYLTEMKRHPEIVILPERYRHKVWPNLDQAGVEYMESGLQFYGQLLRYDGLMLHASAVEFEEKAYLFSGPSGMGKSTHTKLWQQVFGPAAQVFNDDKPALRFVEGKWYAYGTPWCGKDGINQNKKVPLAGICFLKRGEENTIRELTIAEAIPSIVSQTRRKLKDPELGNLMLQHVEKLVTMIPVFELHNRPEPEAAILSCETMRKKAEEMGL